MGYSKNTKEMTTKEWRDLGFFYQYNDEKNAWHFVASKSGLEKIVMLINKYVSNPKNNKKAEHEHYGPYMYLKIMTWDSPDINDQCIQGTIHDLKKLSDIILENLVTKTSNQSFVINQAYTSNAKSSLIFEIREDNFDPASLDRKLMP